MALDPGNLGVIITEPANPNLRGSAMPNPQRISNLQQYVRDFVVSLPADLYQQLAELEAKGQLESLLEATFSRMEATKTLGRVAAKMFLTEARPALDAAVRSLRNSNGAYQLTIKAGSTNVLSADAQRKPAIA